MGRQYKTSSLSRRGPIDKDGDTTFKSVNVSIDYRTYCKLKVVSAHTGKTMKKLLIESFKQVHGEPTDADVAAVEGVTLPESADVTPIEFDTFTGLPVNGQPVPENYTAKIDNPAAKRFFKRPE
jgi:hypothetical protein